MPQAPIELLAQDISKSFGEKSVLAKIGLEVARGQLLAIVGSSGSGKTVLLHIISGLMAPDHGRVLAADHSRPDAPLTDLASLDGDGLDALRTAWGVVFQHNALFSGSVHENMAIILRERGVAEDEIDRRAIAGLKAVALNPDEVLSKDRDELSGGMAKRVAIARAIAIDPALFFFDEPTTGLDPVIGGQIHELIYDTHMTRRADGLERTTIVVTHDKDLLRRIRPRVVLLADGGFCFDGSYDEFARDDACGQAQAYIREMPVLHARRLS